MPELPEVETVRQDLEKAVLGRTLLSLDVSEPRLLQQCTQSQLKEALCGKRLEALDRRGKFLLFNFGLHCALVHLRMSGWFSEKHGTHTRMVWGFSGKTIYFDDTRRFATLHLVKTDHLLQRPPLAGLGQEPLSSDFTAEALRSMFDSTREVKRLLLDQGKVAGLGNIYVCEILYRAGIDPREPVHRISKQKTKRLHRAIIETLNEAIARHGSTLGSAVGDYRTLSGAQGGFQDRFAVYGKQGEPCFRCQTPIKRISQAQRSTFFCPKCQR